MDEISISFLFGPIWNPRWRKGEFCSQVDRNFWKGNFSTDFSLKIANFVKVCCPLCASLFCERSYTISSFLQHTLNTAATSGSLQMTSSQHLAAHGDTAKARIPGFLHLLSYMHLYRLWTGWEHINSLIHTYLQFLSLKETYQQWCAIFCRFWDGYSNLATSLMWLIFFSCSSILLQQFGGVLNPFGPRKEIEWI